MVGILLITHNALGDSLLDCVGHVLGGAPPHVASLSVLADDDPQQKEEEARALVRSLDQGEGVLVLTDLFGSTPSNISSRLCKRDETRLRGIAGVNLPMLLRAVAYRNRPLAELAELTLEGGRNHIVPINCAD